MPRPHMAHSIAYLASLARGKPVEALGCLVPAGSFFRLPEEHRSRILRLRRRRPSVFVHLLCHLVHLALGMLLHVPTGARILGHLVRHLLCLALVVKVWIPP